MYISFLVGLECHGNPGNFTGFEITHISQEYPPHWYYLDSVNYTCANGSHIEGSEMVDTFRFCDMDGLWHWEQYGDYQCTCKYHLRK